MASRRGIKAGRAFVELGVDDRIARGLKKAQRRLRAFGAGVQQVGARLAKLGAVAAVGLFAATKVFASMGDQMAKMAKRTGFSVEALSELRFAAIRSGTSIEALETGMRRMQRSVYDAGRELSTQVDALADLGLEYKDLHGLAPEEQFKLLAEAIHRVGDATTKAALAQAIFGRAGTGLLPMFTEGAAGIERLQKASRRLGLTMTAVDAKAAEDLTDAMGDLWMVIKMGVFRIGSALAPMLEKTSKTMAEVGATVTDWLRRNRGLIVSVSKLVGLVLATGVTLLAAGWAIGKFAALLGVAATAVKLLGAGLALLLSPLGLIVTAIAAMGAVILYATGAGAKALGWLADRFGDLKSAALASYQGIADALASGNIGLAAKIMWLTLKEWWIRGTGWLRRIWAEAWHGMLRLAEDMIHGVTMSIILGRSLWEKAMAHTQGFFRDLATTFEMVALEMGAALEQAINPEFDLAKAEQQIRLNAAKQFAATDRAKDAAIDAANEKYAAEKNLAARLHRNKIVAINKELAAGTAATRTRLQAARKELADALLAAATGRAAGGGLPPGQDPQDFLKGIKDLLAGVDAAAKGAAKAAGPTARGTFYAQAARSLAGATAADRTAKATEETNRTSKLIERNTKSLLRNQMEYGGSRFT